MLRLHIVPAVALVLFGFAGVGQAALLTGLGEISGKITAPKGEIVPIYLMNAEKSVGYSVFAVKGSYRANDIIPGHYDITIRKSGYEMTAVPVDVAAGEHVKVATLAPKITPAAPDYVGGLMKLDAKIEPYEKIYPPGPGRKIVESTCMVCHGPNFLPNKILDREGWDSQLDSMMSDVAFQNLGLVEGPTMFDPKRIAGDDRKILIDYLTANFGPDAEPRAVSQDAPPPLDPAALSKAMFIEYRFLNTKEMPHRWTQEVHFDKDGNVFATDRGRPAAIVRVDPRTGESKTFPTPNPASSPHGLTVDFDGTVWWAGRNVFLSHLDPATGLMDQYAVPELGIHGHTPVFTSKGDLWFSELVGNKIGHWERATDTVTYYETPADRGRPYGLVIDNDDKVWYVEYHTDHVTRFDPVTKEFKRFPIKSSPASLRRLGVDANNIIWYGVYGSSAKKGKLGRLDPKTGDVIERELPIGYSNPYDAWPDNLGHVWVSTDNYLVNFDEKTSKFTTYPIPERTDQPKVMTTREGAVWYAPRNAGAGKLNYGGAAAVLYPDMDAITTLGAYYADNSSANHVMKYHGPGTKVTGVVKNTKKGSQNPEVASVKIVGKDPATLRKGGGGDRGSGMAD